MQTSENTRNWFPAAYWELLEFTNDWLLGEDCRYLLLLHNKNVVTHNSNRPFARDSAAGTGLTWAVLWIPPRVTHELAKF